MTGRSTCGTLIKHPHHFCRECSLYPKEPNDLFEELNSIKTNLKPTTDLLLNGSEVLGPNDIMEVLQASYHYINRINRLFNYVFDICHRESQYDQGCLESCALCYICISSHTVCFKLFLLIAVVSSPQPHHLYLVFT